MILDRVTMTGADDSVDPQKLVDLSARYPNVEWGILFIGGAGARFPTKLWVDELLKVAPPTMNLCAHPEPTPASGLRFTFSEDVIKSHRVILA